MLFLLHQRGNLVEIIFLCSLPYIDVFYLQLAGHSLSNPVSEDRQWGFHFYLVVEIERFCNHFIAEVIQVNF